MHDAVAKVIMPKPNPNSQISKYTDFFSPSAAGNTVDHLVFRFWISLSIPEIFTFKVENGPKSCQI